MLAYSHLSNNSGGWNKHGGGAIVAKSINVEVGINMKVVFFGKTKCINAINVERRGKNLRNQ